MKILHFQCLQDAPDREVEIGAMLDGLGLKAEELQIVRPFVEPATVALLDGVDGVTIGGAGWSTFEEIPYFEDFLIVLREARHRQIPILGICFGAQALARLEDGVVVRDEPREEYGTIDIACEPSTKNDPLFSLLPPTFAAQAWHHDRIVVLPSNTRPLAWSQNGEVLQAYAFTDGPAWGVQFHPERTAETFGHLLETRRAPSPEWPIERIRNSLVPSPRATALLARFAQLCAGRH